MDAPGMPLDSMRNFTPAAEPEGFGKTLGRSFAYSLLQTPTNGLVQIVDRAMNTNHLPDVQIVAPCAKAEFGSLNWHAQQVGNAAGMLPWFVGLNKGAGRLLGNPQRLASTVACSETLAVTSVSRESARSALAGLAYGGVLTPSDPLAGNFMLERVKNGTVSALTFGTLGGSATYLKQFGAFRSPIAAGVASGVPAGFVHAEANSLFHGKGLASGRELTESVYSFMVIGGAFGAGHQYLAGRGRNTAATEAAESKVPEQANVGMQRGRLTTDSTAGKDPLSTERLATEAPPPEVSSTASVVSAVAKPTTGHAEAGSGLVVEANAKAPGQTTLLAELAVNGKLSPPSEASPVSTRTPETGRSFPPQVLVTTPEISAAASPLPVGAKAPAQTTRLGELAGNGKPPQPSAEPSLAVRTPETSVASDSPLPGKVPPREASNGQPGEHTTTFTSHTGVPVRVTHKSRTDSSQEYPEPSRPENTVTQEFNNGVMTWKVTRPDGSVIEVKSPGPWQVKTHNGDVWTKDGEGNVECVHKDGSREVEVAKTGEHYRESFEFPGLRDLGLQKNPTKEPMPERNGEWTKPPEKPATPEAKAEETPAPENEPVEESWHTKVRMNGVEVDIENRPDGTEILRYTEPKTGHKVVETRGHYGVEGWKVTDASGREITSETPGPWEVKLFDRTVTRHKDGTTVEQWQSSRKVGGKDVAATVSMTTPPDGRFEVETIVFKDPNAPGQTVTETHRDFANSTWTAERADGTKFDSNSPGPWSVELTTGSHSKGKDGTVRIEGEIPEKWDAPDWDNIQSVEIRPDGTVIFQYNGHSVYADYTIKPDGTTRSTTWDDYDDQ